MKKTSEVADQTQPEQTEQGRRASSLLISPSFQEHKVAFAIARAAGQEVEWSPFRLLRF